MGSSPPPFSSPSSGEESSSSNGEFLPFPVPPPLPRARKPNDIPPTLRADIQLNAQPARAMPPITPGPPPPVSTPAPIQRFEESRSTGYPSKAMPLPPPLAAQSEPRSQPEPRVEPSYYVPRERKKSPWAILQEKVWEYLSRHERQVPSWMISLCVHVILILVLAFIPIFTQQSTVFNLMLGTPDGGDGESETFELAAGTPEDFQVSSDSVSLEAMNFESSLPVVEDGSLPSMELASDGNEPLAISMGLTGRDGTLKDALLGAYGGNQHTEDAVDLGLQWLVKVQSRDGSWTLSGPFADSANSDNRLAATSMALIAFAGSGSSHAKGKYHEVVSKGVKQLVKWQNEQGSFLPKGRLPDQHMAYSHAQATIALCELYGMTRDQTLREPAQLAVNFAQDWQDPDKGGWRYYPRTDSDLSVTGWYVMALISARMAGLSTDKTILDKAMKYLDTVCSKDGSRYYYTDYSLSDEQDGILLDRAMTAEGLLCRMYLGWTPFDPRVAKGASILLEHPVTLDVADRDYYYWYYCTQVMHHAGHPAWPKWNEKMRELLPALQTKSGRETGSWPPQGDPHGNIGGRLYSTCLAIYCLEVYYRHLPLYNSKAQHTVKN